MAFDKQKFKAEMKRAGVTQKQLAEMHGVQVRQVSRWLNSKDPLKSDKIRDLCVSIGVSPEDLDEDWVGTLDTKNTARVSAKISSASKNAYWLLKQKFGVTETQIVELAPTLFAMFAGATLEQFHRGENDIAKQAFEVLAEQFGIEMADDRYPPHPEEIEIDTARERYISAKLIFGGDVIVERYDEYVGTVNPFAAEMEKFIKPSKNVTVSRTVGGECPTSQGNAVCVESIDAISGGNAEISEAIRYGHIELFCDEFENLSKDSEARLHWMQDIVTKMKDERAQREAELNAKLAAHRDVFKKLYGRKQILRLKLVNQYSQSTANQRKKISTSERQEILNEMISIDNQIESLYKKAGATAKN
jgi:transcriptional regulator with XRE-family HTH domain